MDASDIFKKLSAGAKFNVKKFRNDSQKPQIGKPSTPELPLVKEELANEKKKPEVFSKRIKQESDVEDDELILLGSITAAKEGPTVRKKVKVKKKMTGAKLAALKQEQISQIRNRHQISVVGQNVPAPVEEFGQLAAEYGVSQDLVERLHECGYTAPTPIQMQAIPIMLKSRQLLACAPTGSGKTAAFLVPVIHQLKGPRKRGFRAVIVSPTRELAKQTYRECLRLAEGTNLRIHIISKVNHAKDKFGPQSSQRFDILVTTPNRLVYLLRQDPPVLSLNNVEWLIVDESDKLFEVGQRGFRDQLGEIYRACDSENVRRAMFSATHTPDVANWARKNLSGLISVTIGHRNAAADIVDQQLMFVGSESGKLVAFRELIQKGLTPPVLVFVQTKERAKELFTELIYDGINVDVIHADRTQLQRDNVVRSFREGKIWVLICTELMARGIDFKGVNLVINYDFPPSAISYIHRIGRTGRAGRPGKAITFFTEDDTVCLRSIAHVVRDSGCDVPEYLLTLKKASKRARRKLESKAPTRDSISTIPAYEKHRKEKLKKRIEKTKKLKKKQEQKRDDSKTEETLVKKRKDSDQTAKVPRKKKGKISDSA
ncbi:probable ATP-dependent RNA helicase DDX52 isoform X1 [Anabrus simplex]|uniref:probable ATP-dependent RNA helicase DDX52 isoform X1 n=1 Tax=Anabrus simplex TaxID=316456 RepID=UPI0035A31E28